MSVRPLSPRLVAAVTGLGLLAGCTAGPSSRPDLAVYGGGARSGRDLAAVPRRRARAGRAATRASPTAGSPVPTWTPRWPGAATFETGCARLLVPLDYADVRHRHRPEGRPGTVGRTCPRTPRRSSSWTSPGRWRPTLGATDRVATIAAGLPARPHRAVPDRHRRHPRLGRVRRRHLLARPAVRVRLHPRRRPDRPGRRRPAARRHPRLHLRLPGLHRPGDGVLRHHPGRRRPRLAAVGPRPGHPRHPRHRLWRNRRRGLHRPLPRSRRPGGARLSHRPRPRRPPTARSAPRPSSNAPPSPSTPTAARQPSCALGADPAATVADAITALDAGPDDSEPAVVRGALGDDDGAAGPRPVAGAGHRDRRRGGRASGHAGRTCSTGCSTTRSRRSRRG